MADAGTPILSLTPTAILLPSDVIPIARPAGTTAPGYDLGLTGAALLASFSVNNLTITANSNTTPPSIDAVNAGLALKANTADVAATIQSITTLDASQTAAIAAAQALLSTDGNLITAITATQTAQGASIATNTQNITANTAAIALKADKSAIIAAVNNLTTTAVSNITPPTIDAVNGAVNGFALQYIGPPANGNIQIGRAYGTFTVPADAQNCVFENGTNATIGAAVTQLYIGASTIGTTVGSNTTGVTVGRASGSIVIGANITNASVGASSNGVTIGDNCTSVSVGDLNSTVSIGTGVINSVIGTRCANVTIGASASYLTVGIGCRNITVNPSCASVFIGQSSLDVIVGGATAALKSLGIDLSSFSRSVTVNLGQQQLRLIGCNFFTAPAGNNRTYLSNLLIACTTLTAATNKGAYTNATAYNPNDQVTNAGQAYLANSAFTSGASFDPTAWTAYYPPSAAGTATAGPTGATGATSGPAGIDYTSPITLTAAATLAVNKAYYATGGGYALTLPDPAANLGAAIFVSVASNATGLFSVSGTTLTLYAAESIGLRATADGWKKTGGELLPMSVRIETTLSQQNSVPAGYYYTVPLSVTVRSVSSLPGMIDLPGSAIVVQRTGRANVSGIVTLQSAVANNTYFMGIRITSVAGAVSYIAQMIPSATKDGLVQAIVPAPSQTYTAGDRVQLYIYAQSDSPNLRGQFNGSQCSLTYTEL